MLGDNNFGGTTFVGFKKKVVVNKFQGATILGDQNFSGLTNYWVNSFGG